MNDLNENKDVNAGELLKIMFQISHLDLQNPDILEEQLIGVDVAYFDRLIIILRSIHEKKKTDGKDYELMTPEYFNSIIDKIFNEDDSDEEDEKVIEAEQQ